MYEKKYLNPDGLIRLVANMMNVFARKDELNDALHVIN